MNVSSNQTRVCLTIPSKVQSLGLWKQFSSDDKTRDYHWLDFSLPRLELMIGVIFVITHTLHFFLKRLGFPLFTSQLLAGLFLSPAVLTKERAGKLMTNDDVQVFGALGATGFVFFMFLTGVKMDPGMVTRMGKRALTIGLLLVVVPLICIAFIFPALVLEKNQQNKILFMSRVYCNTALPSISWLLSDLKITNSELGRLALSSALVSDLSGALFVFISNAVRVSVANGVGGAIKHVSYALVVFVIICYVFRPAMKWIVRCTPEGKPVRSTFITIISILCLLSISMTRWQPSYLFLVPYTLGLAVPHGPPLGSALVEKLESIVNNLFIPLFVTAAGMRVTTLDIRNITDSKSVAGSGTLITTMVTLVKFVVALLPPLYSQMPTRDCCALASILSSKGVVELSVFAALFDDGRINGDIYSLVTILILNLASITPVLVKLLYNPSRKYSGYDKRTIMDIKPHAELHIVACIHVPDNVRAVINLLEASCPSKDNPMTVNVLHLVKLRGQTTPIFIAHQKKGSAPSTWSYSENVIVSFNKYEGDNWGAVSVNNFTAVSPPNLMDDDICTLALDKVASLIILPFHRSWYIDGSIESDDEEIRILNSKVLEKAPCSVGILIDRGKVRRQMQDLSMVSSYNIAMIFLGGRDDREALTFALRMAKEAEASLSVMHLKAYENNDHTEEWDKVVDNEYLKEVKTNGYINYMEKEVNDGPETAMIIRSMVSEFNLIIVGRRDNFDSPQTSGLQEWSEFRELGALGDLLASIDYSGKCSVLVVRQQHKT